MMTGTARSLPIMFALACIAFGSGSISTLSAQADTVETLPWVDRELRYWSGLPMMGGANGECIAGYTEEESYVYLFADGRFQQITFEDRRRILTFPAYGITDPCEPLEGDTLSMVTGRWTVSGDTLLVKLDRTSIFPYEPFITEWIERAWGTPFIPSMPPTRTCTGPSDRALLIAEDAIQEGWQVWR